MRKTMRSLYEFFRDIWLALQEKAIVHSFKEALAVADDFGYPVCLRPSCTLNGVGTYPAEGEQELKDGWQRAFDLSPVGEVLIEKIRQL